MLHTSTPDSTWMCVQKGKLQVELDGDVMFYMKVFLVVSPSTANLGEGIPSPAQANLSQFRSHLYDRCLALSARVARL